MPVWTKPLKALDARQHPLSRRRGLVALLLLALGLGAVLAWGAEFKILRADTRLIDDVYLLDADIRFELSPAVLEALSNSVPITFSLQMQIRRRRPLLWDETVASLQQDIRLHYHALAQQYVVTDLNSGAQHSYPTRTAALRAIGEVKNFPLLDRDLLADAEDHYVSLKAELDIEALPAPLRPMAYLSSDWRLSSEWYSWPL